jgi:hypothetical protein
MSWRPHLVRRGCGQFGFDSGGVAGLAAPFPGFAGLAQQAVKHRNQSEVDALVEQGGPRGPVRHRRTAGLCSTSRIPSPLLTGQRPRLEAVAVWNRRWPRRCGAGPVAPVVAACAAPTARQAARTPICPANSVTAASVTASTRARVPRSDCAVCQSGRGPRQNKPPARRSRSP